MAEARVGDLVQVDMSGVEAAGVSFGEGIFAPGEIKAIDPDTLELRVRLGFSADHDDLITVPAARAKLVPAEQADPVRAALSHAG
jgi:hypothetical protein